MSQRIHAPPKGNRGPGKTESRKGSVTISLRSGSAGQNKVLRQTSGSVAPLRRNAANYGRGRD